MSVSTCITITPINGVDQRRAAQVGVVAGVDVEIVGEGHGVENVSRFGVGLPPADADKVARLMAQADLQGSDGHGVIRLPQYVKRIRAGGINVAPIEVEEVLLSHPAVQAAFVTGVPDAKQQASACFINSVHDDMESIMAGRYPGPGITLGPAMTFGFLSEGGGRHTITTRTHQPELVADERYERVLYDPADPRRTLTVRAFIGHEMVAQAVANNISAGKPELKAMQWLGKPVQEMMTSGTLPNGEKAFAHARFFEHQGVLYEVLMMGPGEQANPDAATSWFGGFSLLGQ